MAVEIKHSTFGAAPEAATETETTQVETAPTVEAKEEAPIVQEAEMQITPETTENNQPQIEAQPEQVALEENSANVSFDLGINPQGEQAAEPTKTYASWKDAIKEADKTELLKELGFDEFAKEFLEFRQNGGDPYQYLAVKAIDYNKVPDIELVKYELKQNNPTFTDEDIDLFVERKYNLSEFADDDDKKFGELTLKQEAHKLRQQKIEEQKKFDISQVGVPEETKQMIEHFSNAQLQAEKTKESYLNNDNTKALLQSKRVAVEIGDGKVFNFNVERPEVINQAILDGDMWNKLTTTPQGEPDVKKLQRLALVALNPNYERDLVNYGISLGEKKVLLEGQNAKRPVTNLPINTNERGVVVTNTNGRLGSHLR